MSNTNPIPYAEKWIYQQLSGSATITGSIVGTRIFRNNIPQADDGSLRLPAIRFFYSSGRDIKTFNSNIIYGSLWYQIEVIDRAASNQHLRAIANEIQRLFHKTNGVVDGVTILSSERLYAIAAEAIESGEQYQHLGGVYQIRVGD